MANYFYVKTDGTATTATATATTAPGTKRTGAWSGTSGDHFATVTLAMLGDDTVAPVAGDFICVSDAHSFSTGSAVSWDTPVSTTTPIMVISVDNANQENAKEATTKLEDAASTYQLCSANGGKVALWGLFLESSQAFEGGGAETCMMATNCIFQVDSAGDRAISNASSPGGYWTLYNCTLNINNATAIPFEARAGSHIFMFGGSVNGSPTFAELLGPSTGLGGGGHVELDGVNIEDCTGYLLSNVGGDEDFDTTTRLILRGCKLNSGVTFVEESILNWGISILATNCSNTIADAEWQYYYEDMLGSVEAVDTSDIWRQDTDSTRVFPGGETISFKAITKATTAVITPFRFNMPASFMQLSSATSDKIRIYFVIATGTTLYDTDVWADVVYPDGTNKQTWSYLSNQNANPMLDIGGGTVHTTDGGSDWRNAGAALTSYNEYYMDLDTFTADPGADSVPTITVNVAIPSATIYFAMHVDAVAH